MPQGHLPFIDNNTFLYVRGFSFYEISLGGVGANSYLCELD